MLAALPLAPQSLLPEGTAVPVAGPGSASALDPGLEALEQAGETASQGDFASALAMALGLASAPPLVAAAALPRGQPTPTAAGASVPAAATSVLPAVAFPAPAPAGPRLALSGPPSVDGALDPEGVVALDGARARDGALHPGGVVGLDGAAALHGIPATVTLGGLAADGEPAPSACLVSALPLAGPLAGPPGVPAGRAMSALASPVIGQAAGRQVPGPSMGPLVGGDLGVTTAVPPFAAPTGALPDPVSGPSEPGSPASARLEPRAAEPLLPTGPAGLGSGGETADPLPVARPGELAGWVSRPASGAGQGERAQPSPSELAVPQVQATVADDEAPVARASPHAQATVAPERGAPPGASDRVALNGASLASGGVSGQPGTDHPLPGVIATPLARATDTPASPERSAGPGSAHDHRAARLPSGPPAEGDRVVSAVGAPAPGLTGEPTVPAPALSGPEAEPVSGLEVPGGEPALLAGLARHGVPAERAGAVTVAMGELATPVGHPRWANGLADRVSWLAAGEVRRARLELSPPDLGPLEVHITVVDDEARVAFASPHAPVREAVEGALPKLREMLGASGLSLVHVDVSSQSGGYRPPPGSDPAASPAGGRAGVVAALPVSSRQAVGEATPGLFDAYA